MQLPGNSWIRCIGGSGSCFDSQQTGETMGSTVVCRLLLLALLFSVVGCSSKNKGKIEGTKWTCRAATVKGNTLPAGSLRLDFNNDGTMAYYILEKPIKGTYTLGTGDTVTFHLDEAIGGKKEGAEKIVISGDALTMTDSDGTSLTFDKVK
jgi:hypothetical protein